MYDDLLQVMLSILYFSTSNAQVYLFTWIGTNSWIKFDTEMPAAIWRKMQKDGDENVDFVLRFSSFMLLFSWVPVHPLSDAGLVVI